MQLDKEIENSVFNNSFYKTELCWDFLQPTNEMYALQRITIRLINFGQGRGKKWNL